VSISVETLKICAEYTYKGKNIAQHHSIEPENANSSLQNLKVGKADLFIYLHYDELPKELKAI
jgi:adenylosuccinate synthase